jgi:PAS domain S-box-containing protein
MRPPPKDIEPSAARRRSAGTKGTGTGRSATRRKAAPLLDEKHFRRFAESSDDVLWVADLVENRLLYVSPRFEEMWGMDVADVMSHPEVWREAVVDEDAHLLPDPFFADDLAREESVREYRIRLADGQVRWVRDRRFPVRDDDAGVLRVGGIVEDVTERKQRELQSEQLLQRERAARADAEAAASAKDEFLAVVTHELRSPLNAIRGWSHVLRHAGQLQPIQMRAIEAIDRNTHSQAQLVDDLLDSQRILCGKLQLDIGRVPLPQLIEEAVETVSPAAQMKRLRLELAHDPSVTMVKADPDRLRQALTKLVANAVKFTPEDGIVTVTSRRTPEGVSISVQDTGVGLEPEQLHLVFDRFQQGDSSNTRRANGLGLGLSLARQLIELHGGRITAASEGVGRGATFTIELPPEAVCDDVLPDAAGGAASTLAGKKIVVVEDDDDGREALSLILRDAQVELHSFDRAAAAYDFIAHASAEEQPDALISDIAMPDEDGYHFIQRVRQMEGRRRGRHIAALALTSFARVEDRIQALKAGFDAHVAKPIDPERVLCTLAQALGLAEGQDPVTA